MSYLPWITETVPKITEKMLLPSNIKKNNTLYLFVGDAKRMTNNVEKIVASDLIHLNFGYVFQLMMLLFSG